MSTPIADRDEVLSVTLYDDGKEREWTVCYDDGSLRERIAFLPDRRRTVSNHWHPDGAPSAYAYSSGLSIAWYPNGTVRELGWYHRNGRKGTWRTYYPTGALASEGDYDSSPALTSTTSHRKTVVFIPGKAVGRWTHFYESGASCIEENFENGFRDGSWILRWPDGSLRIQGSFFANMPTGDWIEFDRAGERLGLIHCEGGSCTLPSEVTSILYREDDEPRCPSDG